MAKYKLVRRGRNAYTILALIQAGKGGSQRMFKGSAARYEIQAAAEAIAEKVKRTRSWQQPPLNDLSEPKKVGIQ